MKDWNRIQHEFEIISNEIATTGRTNRTVAYHGREVHPLEAVEDCGQFCYRVEDNGEQFWVLAE